MAQFTEEILPGRTAVVAAEGALADVYRRDPRYTEVLEDDAVEALTGPEVDELLRAQGLPTSGKVAERKARLLSSSPEAPTDAAPPTAPDPGVVVDRDAEPAGPTPRAATPRDADEHKEN